ncbi:sn-glycerol-3-phosphate ABC transporter ATP-binding protein UgpC (plasmid) [Xanthobacter dioxanivorans]|uniref:Sn-glycerol-3-phosphate ABC transporter ATP-binding protein UgpC n=1 Tax=Xanthobacter dioxanivorans TaxID=2528964 RepID=A0A974PUN6_9HYPH|nr:sn-glycerol-3-phosphate ABC transporter ATP-binding protein UgpC [Xanthobacter dioxanivorans]QRG10035.1 sn-glycerol-3-phosphate ABC transporter ATP-binding protein UgpC [Xanthobacter dioxanivorans]
MARITLQNVSKSFGGDAGPWAVRDFSLDIDDGELVVFVGPSGCGKSTTLRMLAGLDEATSGTISIGGRDVTQLPPKDRNIAMVFQNYALYPQKTVYHNMAFGLRVRGEGKAEIDRRVRAAAASLDLGHLLERKPRQLSGGQMQRVALGRALVRNLDAFLLDEPLSNLDAKLRVKMREEIATLHARLNATMIFVTHDQVEAMTLGDRIVIMRDGLIQQAGKPLELYDRPANTFVAAFIGSPEMNLVEGQLVRESGKLSVRAGGLNLQLPEKAFSESEQDVVLGIRPEHISIADSSPVLMNVNLVEQIGAQTYVLGTISGHKFRAVLSRKDDVVPGQTIPVMLPKERIHLFTRSTGRTLRLA